MIAGGRTNLAESKSKDVSLGLLSALILQYGLEAAERLRLPSSRRIADTVPVAQGRVFQPVSTRRVRSGSQAQQQSEAACWTNRESAER